MDKIMETITAILDEMRNKFIDTIETSIDKIFEKYKYEKNIEPELAPKIEEKQKIPHEEDEDELLIPDHDLRSQNSAWLHKYNRRPPFAYISTPADLKCTVTSLLTQDENDILEDSYLLDNLCQLNSTIQGKTLLINSENSCSL
jgi:hypothetical protein